MTTTLSDTSTWLPLNQLAIGFDAGKAPVSHDLDGRTFRLRDDETGASRTFQAAETFLVADELYYVQFPPTGRETVSLVLDLQHGRALIITTTINASGTPRVTQEFRPATLEDDATGKPMAPSTALLGRRALWIYSAEHAYEHVYLTPHWYTWHCLAGPERGLADTDENTVYEVRPGIYVFAWREKVIHCASVTIADHRDLKNLRSHGVLFGLDETGENTTQFTFGAHGRLLSTTTHPDDLDPARA